MADGLINSFSETNLDLENSLPNGGPIKYPLPSYVSPNATGTPNKTSNPGPFKGFTQPYTPQNPYLNSINNKIIKTSTLSDNEINPSVLSITSLDNSQPGINGGVPYKTVDDPTVYPESAKASSPVRGYFSTPGAAAQKYGSNTSSIFTSTDTYMKFIDSYIRE
jgi:hypothetical protein